MSRVQLALNVSDLEASVEFYASLFGVSPHKRRPGYANFAVNDPPLMLVLIEVPADARGRGTVDALNHLGIEVETTTRVDAEADRLRDAGLAAVDEAATTCCFALQDKVWLHDPAGAPWEIYTVKDDDPDGLGLGPLSPNPVGTTTNDGGCCTTPVPAGRLGPVGASCC